MINGECAVIIKTESSHLRTTVMREEKKVINIAIIEDNKVTVDSFKKFVNKYCEENSVELQVSHFGTAEKFLEAYRPNVYAVVFMDIELPGGMDGLEAARLLRERDKSVTLLFFTRLAQYAQKGYEVDALDFLIKPLNYADFSLKMKKALNVARSMEARSVMVPVHGGYTCVSTDKIIFVEVIGHQLRYQLVDGIIETRGSLSAVEKQVKNSGFLRCNSCYLINARFIDNVQGYDVEIAGYTLKISHPRRKQFVKELMEFFQGGGVN